jgi:chemotaxis protein MotA
MGVPVCAAEAESAGFAGKAGRSGKILPVGGNALPRRGNHVAAAPAKPNWPAPCTCERMDFASFPGLAPFIDPLAFAIVGGGTALVTVLRTPGGDLVRGIIALGVLPRRMFDAEPLVEQVAALTRIAKRHGVMALDRSVISDRDVAAAVVAVVDGATPAEIEHLVEDMRVTRFERQRAAYEMWAGAAEVAPAMGMVGTLVGLVQMFSSLRDTSAVGGAMAVALLATLYGALLANLIALPVAARLKRRARAEATGRGRLVAPLAALGAIEPMVRRERHEMAA